MKIINILVSMALINSVLLLLGSFYSIGFSQSISLSELEDVSINLNDVTNEDFEDFYRLDSLLKGVEIIMLGEQSHGDGTTFQTKIKLIKYLHQNLGYDILAFETGMYDCSKAWEDIQNGQNVRNTLGKSIQSLWSTLEEFVPLSNYIEQTSVTESPLKLMGFDNQHYSKISKDDLINDLSLFLKETLPQILDSNEWSHFKTNFALLTNWKIKAVKKNNPELDTLFLNDLARQLKPINSSGNWPQVLKSLKCYISDTTLGTDFRDKQMADNLIWIKETNPNSKIICWGATSHFLYNSMDVRMKSPIVALLGGNYYKKQPMMGDYIKKRYGEKLFTVGFTAYEGTYGVIGYRKKLKHPKANSIEHILGQSELDNFLIPLENLNLEGLLSRPLGHRYVKTNVSETMDAIIFNRYMHKPKLDNNFFLQMYPENKYIKPTSSE